MNNSLLSHSGASASTNEENEYVWDGYTQGTDQLIVTPSANNDYYEDLELAARLGKTLLEKNKELETLNYQLKYYNDEQSQEIEHLSKQLMLLRDVNDSKSKMYEQLDVSNQELENSNKLLRKENKDLKERFIRCCSICDTQEEQLQSMRIELEAVKNAQEKKKTRERMRRRTVHSCLPSTEKTDSGSKAVKSVTALLEYLENSTNDDLSVSLQDSLLPEKKDGDAEEIFKLREVIANLKAQQSMDKRMVNEIKTELSVLVEENHEYIERLREEKEINVQLTKIIEEYERANFHKDFANTDHNLSAEIENADINFSLRSEIDACEHDNNINKDLTQESSHIRKLQDQQPPLEQYLKITNSTPVKDTSSESSNVDMEKLHPDYFVIKDKSSNSLPNQQNSQSQGLSWLNSPNSSDDLKKENKNVSLVQELDTQYKTLLEKYEKLLESIEMEKDELSSSKDMINIEAVVNEKCKKNIEEAKLSAQKYAKTKRLPDSANPQESDSCNNNINVKNMNSLSDIPSKDCPEYKRLFKEIFAILNRVRSTPTVSESE